MENEVYDRLIDALLLRAEAAGLGVKVSAFCPGGIGTPLIEKSMVVNSSMDEILSLSRMKIMD